MEDQLLFHIISKCGKPFFFIDLSNKRIMSPRLFGKNRVEKFAVAAKCKTADCQFNGIVLISKKKSKEISLKDEKCPLCHNLGQLELIFYN